MSTPVPSSVNPYPPVPGQPSGAGTFEPPHPYRSAEANGPFGNHATLGDGLVSYWPLGEESGVRADLVGTNDLTDNNTVGFASVTGPPNFPAGKVASFVAANSEYLSLASGIAELDDQFTIAGWVKQTTYQAEAGFMANGADGDMGLRVTFNVVGNGDCLVRVPTNATDTTTYGYTATGEIPTGAWRFLVVAYDGSQAAADRLNVYIDDASKALTKSGTHPASIRVGASFRIGRGGDANYASVDYGGFGIWSRVLTAQERTDLYAAGAGLFYED